MRKIFLFSGIFAILLIVWYLILKFYWSPVLPQFKEGQTQFSTKDIFNVIYSNYHYPGDFNTNSGTGSYTSTQDLHPFGDVKGEDSIELCAHTISELINWVNSLQDIDDRLERTITQQGENEKYYEILLNLKSDTINQNVNQRAHNCKYIEFNKPYSWLRFDEQKIIVDNMALLKVRPITPSSIKELGEYLWYIHYGGLVGSKVLSSAVKQDNSFVTHTMYVTSRTVGYDLPTVIHINRYEHTVDTTSGLISMNIETVQKCWEKRAPFTGINYLSCD